MLFSAATKCYLTILSVGALFTPSPSLLVHLLLCSWSYWFWSWLTRIVFLRGLSRHQPRMWETHKRSRIKLVRPVHPLNLKVIYGRLTELLKLGNIYYTQDKHLWTTCRTTVNHQSNTAFTRSTDDRPTNRKLLLAVLSHTACSSQGLYSALNKLTSFTSLADSGLICWRNIPHSFDSDENEL